MVAPAEAAKRGWVTQEEVGYRLTGADASARVLPILGQFGSLYNRGAKTTVSVLDVAELEIEGGGRVRLTVEDASPAAMKRLGELFEVLATVAKPGKDTSVELDIAEPDQTCLLIKALKGGKGR